MVGSLKRPGNVQIGTRIKQLIILVAITLLGILFTTSVYGQSYQKDKKRFYRYTYRASTSRISNACHLLKKKRHSTKNRHVPSRGTPKKNTSMAEVGEPVATVKKTTPVLTPKPVAKIATPAKPHFTPTPIVSKETLDKAHSREDEVLKLNHLPTPTSEKHEEIRRLVSNTLNKKTDGEPIILEPLYFTFDKDEFSIVDMDPFLIAVEFALQGKHVLIEGHTDHQGADDYNVQLSIKRVEKIRQLMLDMGVSDDHISVVGYGEEVTDHADKSTDGRQQNRRVDFTVF